jgi:hypothetical protein
MGITAVAPARYANGLESNDLQDVTHACVQCGATLVRTIRPLRGNVALKSGIRVERMTRIGTQLWSLKVR